MPTARDHRFVARLQSDLGSRFHNIVPMVIDKGWNPGVVRPGGEKKVSMYVVHHINGHAKPLSWGWDTTWNFHINSKGWDTGGYNVMVDYHGHAWLAAYPSRMTYGAGPKWNPITFHICALMDCEDAPPSTAMLNTIYTLLCACDDVLGYYPWRPHGAIRQTKCPGGQLERHVWKMASLGAQSPRPSRYA